MIKDRDKMRFEVEINGVLADRWRNCLSDSRVWLSLRGGDALGQPC